MRLNRYPPFKDSRLLAVHAPPLLQCEPMPCPDTRTNFNQSVNCHTHLAHMNVLGHQRRLSSCSVAMLKARQLPVAATPKEPRNRRSRQISGLRHFLTAEPKL